MEKNKIGNYIASKRKEKGLTQLELGNKLSVTDKAISKWERGLGLPDVAILTELAKALDTSVSNILNGEDNTKDINIDDKLESIRKEINSKNKKRITLIVIIALISISVIVISIYYVIASIFKHSSKSIRHINITTSKERPNPILRYQASHKLILTIRSTNCE